MSMKLHVPETTPTTAHDDTAPTMSASCKSGGPLTRFAGSKWAVIEGLGFLVIAAGMTLATAYLTHIDVWYKPDFGWGETVHSPNLWSWFIFPCYAIGWALLASWWWERRRKQRKQQAQS